MVTRFTLYLSVSNNTDNPAVLLHLGNIFFDLLFTKIISPLLGVLAKGLLLGTVPKQLEM